jgi:hypothetical protein
MKHRMSAQHAVDLKSSQGAAGTAADGPTQHIGLDPTQVAKLQLRHVATAQLVVQSW